MIIFDHDGMSHTAHVSDVSEFQLNVAVKLELGKGSCTFSYTHVYTYINTQVRVHMYIYYICMHVCHLYGYTYARIITLWMYEVKRPHAYIPSLSILRCS